MPELSRRMLLKLMAMGAVAAVIPPQVQALTVPVSPRRERLERSLRTALQGRDAGFDLRAIDPRDGYEFFHFQHNADQLYPVASVFKVLVAFYYFWHTPPEAWRYAPGDPIYSVIVYSHNTRTGAVLAEIGDRFEFFGNSIQKFNDFLIYTLGMENGLHSWNWEGSVTEEQADFRFRPSDERSVRVGGMRYRMDNVFTAADFADIYAMLLNPETVFEGEDAEIARQAAEKTLELCSIPAPHYPSPIERAFPQGYTGKDGTLPADSSAIGRVVNDAGIVGVGESTYIISYLSGGEGEYRAMEFLRLLARLLDEYEGLV